MVVKTFRGLLANGGQDRIRLSTIKGKVGYRIRKFQMMGNVTVSATATVDHVMKVYHHEQSTVPSSGATIDLTDSNILAVGLLSLGSTYGEYSQVIIFDQVTFNQDIYITQTDNDGTDSCNYYIELEVIPLDAAGAEYTTLKDMRSSGT